MKESFSEWFLAKLIGAGELEEGDVEADDFNSDYVLSLTSLDGDEVATYMTMFDEHCSDNGLSPDYAGFEEIAH